ncbi:MAG: amidohydrolase family protein [Candidatus Obscuribacterales bacterium]|nr:amidohydrolase family protein [Candidatus Obscuribacterales bacterium]
MKRLVIKGGLVVTPVEERFASVFVEQDRITGLGDSCQPQDSNESSNAKDLCKEDQIIDATNCYVTPALFDIQVNGAPECDFWTDLSKSKINAFSERLLAHGVGTILPTLITGDIKRLQTNRDFLKSQIGLTLSRQFSGDDAIVRMPGIHFEGPCISPEKPGVHPKEHLQALSVDVLKKLVDEDTKLVTLAPELDPSGNALSFLAEHRIAAALGHSNATFEEAQKAFQSGVGMMTHTYNALPAIHHRKPGAVTAAFLDKRVTCAVIPDGHHVDPAMVALLTRMKGTDRTILVSDVAAVGTSQGGLVGSSILLDEAVRNVVNWGIASFREAIQMAAYNPAKYFELQNEIGALVPGAYADIVLWDRTTLEIKHVIFNGCLIGSRGKSSVLSA